MIYGPSKVKVKKKINSMNSIMKLSKLLELDQQKNNLFTHIHHFKQDDSNCTKRYQDLSSLEKTNVNYLFYT